MRRILACISNGRRDFGDISTLLDPDVVEKIWGIVQGEGSITI
jgi:acetyl-CoA synthetase